MSKLSLSQFLKLRTKLLSTQNLNISVQLGLQTPLWHPLSVLPPTECKQGIEIRSSSHPRSFFNELLITPHLPPLHLHHFKHLSPFVHLPPLYSPIISISSLLFPSSVSLCSPSSTVPATVLWCPLSLDFFPNRSGKQLDINKLREDSNSQSGFQHGNL